METQPVEKRGGRRCSIWGSFEACRAARLVIFAPMRSTCLWSRGEGG